jgi:hypothetical protein
MTNLAKFKRYTAQNGTLILQKEGVPRGRWTPTPVHTDYDANFRPNLKTVV